MEHTHRPATDAPAHASMSSKPHYEPPKVTVMSDEEVLSAFQITPAAASWWASM